MRWYLLVSLILCTPAACVTGDAVIDRATMRGLKSVNIVLDPLSPELVKAGITETDLKSRMEVHLTNNHITVDTTAPEFLGLRITHVRDKRGPYAVAFDLGLYQPVVLVRDHNLRSATPTWDVETIVLANPKALRGAALETVDELAASFVRAWRSVNQ
jgi:hypothetical protein